MDIMDVATHIYSDDNNLNNAISYIQQKHYPQIPPEKIKPIFHPKYTPQIGDIILESMSDPRINDPNYYSVSDGVLRKRQPPVNDINWYRKNRPDLIRGDGTLKGKGFLGELPNKMGGYSTELSMSTGDIVPGKDVLIPTMVPTLTKDELDYLLSHKYNPRARTGIDDVISRKAIDFARERKKKGLPYFATKEEEGKFKVQQPMAKPVEKPVQKPTYTSKKKTYQGREFMESTGLRPGLYHPEEVDSAMRRQKATGRGAF